MEKRVDFAEENIHRLVQAGMGEQAQPDRVLRHKMFLLLKDEISSKTTSEFPAVALGLITALLIIISLWWVSQFGNTPSLKTYVIGILIGVNLLSIPFGSFVIVNRRRHV